MYYCQDIVIVSAHMCLMCVLVGSPCHFLGKLAKQQPKKLFINLTLALTPRLNIQETSHLISINIDTQILTLRTAGTAATATRIRWSFLMLTITMQHWKCVQLDSAKIHSHLDGQLCPATKTYPAGDLASTDAQTD